MLSLSLCLGPALKIWPIHTVPRTSCSLRSHRQGRLCGCEAYRKLALGRGVKMGWGGGHTMCACTIPGTRNKGVTQSRCCLGRQAIKVKSDTGDVNADRCWRPSSGETKREKDWAVAGGRGGVCVLQTGLQAK